MVDASQILENALPGAAYWKNFYTAEPPFDPNTVLKTFWDLGEAFLKKPKVGEYTQTHILREASKLNAYLWHRYFGKGEPPAPLYTPHRKDRRFRDAIWEENPFFDTLKQAYLMVCESWIHACSSLETPSPQQEQKRQFFLRQLLDACAPTNFVFSNPAVLRACSESGGENLLQGMVRFLEDWERGQGLLDMDPSDRSAFSVGKNLAVTPGKVIFQNDVMQLIQYSPTTPNVHKRPLLIVPPWISKYYVLDLQPENSFVRWLVSTGVTVFITSWVKATPKHSYKSFEHYVQEGLFEAFDAIHEATQETTLNVLGYCLGGTLLLSALACLRHPKCPYKPSMRVASATLLTTLTDFQEAGFLSIFAGEEDQLRLERRMAHEGFLNGRILFKTFNALRANDLIWSTFVERYLLGKSPVPHDILFWNSDTTHTPRALHSFVLRNFYRKNLLANPGSLKLKGVPIDLSVIREPVFMLSTHDDHIAPWKATYATTRLLKNAPITFLLAGSGHVAGIVNPPKAKKYEYWTNEDLAVQSEDWLAQARKTAGSWWPAWRQWLEAHSGGTVPCRTPGARGPIVEEAPGTYVKA
ncbi:MAG: alpha/beta fold hydrolase [Holosporales bacterium]|nr:alpha/beta fold hydrolase [Holosporales bacterium]